MKSNLLISIFALLLWSCASNQPVSTTSSKHSGIKAAQNTTDLTGSKMQNKNNNQNIKSVQHIIIYKTSQNYNDCVPVILSDDKSTIVSYPHPSDLYYNNNLATPTLLHEGYLLDRRGINKNVAFLKYRYVEYAKLKDVPSLETLKSMIIDQSPLIEIWDCGPINQYSDLEADLNKIIDQKQVSKKFKKIK